MQAGMVFFSLYRKFLLWHFIIICPETNSIQSNYCSISNSGGQMQKPLFIATAVIVLMAATSQSQVNGDFTIVRAEVDFSRKLREWDGFGVNYVEVSQTVDYESDPQEYGGFSLLTEAERQEIIDLIFGDDGLKPAIVKMFYDPWHQKKPGGEFDHETTTGWMRYFVREGLKKTRARGDDLVIFTTLYGPPAWATKQKFLRGRDLDPQRKEDLANYMIDWVEFLREKEGFPVKYLSLHNEGEDWSRWPADGKSGNIGHGHDYNMFWPPEQVVDFLKFMRPMMDNAGLRDVGLTPGEPTNWYRFSAWGYANAIADDPAALQNLGLATSHGFYGGTYGRWFGEHRSVGADVLRSKLPDLHVWVTSTSWSAMDANNIKEMHGNIYSAKVNGITPWAVIQRPAKWVGGDPNPGTAIRVFEDGTYRVMRGYYYFKQVSRAGQTGMAVAWTMCMDSEMAVIAFAKNGTGNPDAFVVVNLSARQDKEISIGIKGTDAAMFEAYQTTDNLSALYKKTGTSPVRSGRLRFLAPARSVTTFYAR
jgi:O-glycosyl hydrolase